ncbi:MAG: hypothetical protein CMM59_13945 [Rhodospirillaceae bacterium]|nr:hypothetical protein [Rhodospirillaceae bacterium]
MSMLEIFGTQLILSLVVFALIARWGLSPWLNRQDGYVALFWLAVPHAFRHLGLVFLVPGVVAPSLPGYFSGAAAYGDLAAGLLAIVSLVALKQRWALALPIVWALNIVGVVDLANALRQAEVIPHFQSAWYIPTFVVPALLVTHAMMLVRLVKMPLAARAAT